MKISHCCNVFRLIISELHNMATGTFHSPAGWWPWCWRGEDEIWWSFKWRSHDILRPREPRGRGLWWRPGYKAAGGPSLPFIILRAALQRHIDTAWTYSPKHPWMKRRGRGIRVTQLPPSFLKLHNPINLHFRSTGRCGDCRHQES